MARLTLERSYGFSASHLYRRPDWSEEENLRRFGRCANLPGHGHNYRLTVWLTGTVDPETGFLIDLAVLDETVRREVLDRVDHQHLNAALPEFAPGGISRPGRTWSPGSRTGSLPGWRAGPKPSSRESDWPRMRTWPPSGCPPRLRKACGGEIHQPHYVR